MDLQKVSRSCHARVTAQKECCATMKLASSSTKENQLNGNSIIAYYEMSLYMRVGTTSGTRVLGLTSSPLRYAKL